MDHRDEETYAIIGAAMEVHSCLGTGFLEAVYKQALCRELLLRCVPFKAEVSLPIHFKGIRLATVYRVDFLCFDHVLVELKALQGIGSSETAQVLNYLKASRLQKALLINFGSPRLQYKRLVL